ncbi:N-acyl homoserine lactonase family protein [Chloroflexota bacterium]
MSYVIRPVLLSVVHFYKALMAYSYSFDEMVRYANVCWYVRADDVNLLVDTAIPVEVLEKRSPSPPQRIASFKEALQRVGITPEEVDLVIQTHLHSDHCGNTKACKNAKVVIQEDELAFALDPHPLFRSYYAPEFFQDVNFVQVRGDEEILPGIRVIHVPGHSPGCQAVSIETTEGNAIISGFCAIKDMFYPPESISSVLPVIPPQIHLDSRQAYESVLKVKGLADIVIPQHEIEFAERDRIP